MNHWCLANKVGDTKDQANYTDVGTKNTDVQNSNTENMHLDSSYPLLPNVYIIKIIEASKLLIMRIHVCTQKIVSAFP